MRKLMMASLAALAASSLCATDMVVRTDWAKSFTVTFSGYEGESTLSGFPALVRIGSSAVSGFSYGDFALENGADLCFADENGVVIPHEIDTWNQNGESLVWVRVPSMKTNAVITAYYGNANAAGVTASDTWAGYAGVWHMGTGSGGTVADAAGHDAGAVGGGGVRRLLQAERFGHGDLQRDLDVPDDAAVDDPERERGGGLFRGK